VGAAIGWMEGEFDALGVPFKERVSRSEEALELMRTLWTQERPELTTARHHLSGLQASPMPLQKPRPPIWIGGGSEGAFRRVARLGDGWHATASTPDAFQRGKQAVTAFWQEAKRDGEPAWSMRIPVFLDGVHRWAVDEKFLRGRHAVRGTVRQVGEQLAEYRRLGVSHMALEVSYSVYPAILETIDLLAREVKPALDRH
jgi:alkanesulfonate monooxygenase SsuD/methylene tetrahydromethanopterin reductase-like flavin-dependent oxidoreductase (luciferase family)